MVEKYGIKISGPDAKYEDAVKAVLDEMAGNYLGPVILGGIIATGKDVTIVPYDAGKAANSGQCNANASADNGRDSAPEGVRGGQKGAGWFLGEMDNRKTPDEDERYRQHEWKEGAGTGEGSTVHIYYTPGVSGGSSCAGDGIYGSLGDEVLFHEMVHALRMTQGLLNPIPTEDSLRGYNNQEEFLAIVATNVYISAKPSTQLRADHRGFRRLQPPLDTSVGFMANRANYYLMQRHSVLWRPTFQELARAGHARRPVFNPFRQMEFERELSPHLPPGTRGDWAR
jgi:hypothetical protein